MLVDTLGKENKEVFLARTLMNLSEALVEMVLVVVGFTVSYRFLSAFAFTCAYKSIRPLCKVLAMGIYYKVQDAIKKRYGREVAGSLKLQLLFVHLKYTLPHMY